MFLSPINTSKQTKTTQNKGQANAASEKIFVRVHADHFGPIMAEHDPVRSQGSGGWKLEWEIEMTLLVNKILVHNLLSFLKIQQSKFSL